MSMDSVIQLVNRLQAACTILGDNAASDGSLPTLWSMLPTIVVVGGQSSGKSSVLESVVGRDFLPRGTGIVTRRPLILQLVPEQDPNAAEWGEFVHLPGQKFYNFDDMSNEITEETARHCAKKKRIVSPDPIQLTVHSPTVPNLTLVDMPGLTKIPIDGQPLSIVQDLENMARTYVKGDNVIILAVTPANADLATSEALRLAKEVDPAGDRTIGVLTKLDIMDPGTDVREVLEGHAVKMKNGWIGVVNRGQADINNKLSMKDARRKEMDYFNTSVYKGLQNVGTTHLSSRLSDNLISAIKRQLPAIQSFLAKSVVDLESEIQSLGGTQVATRGGMVHIILQLCKTFELTFAKTVDGGKGGGERILSVFEHKLTENIMKLNFNKILDPKNVKRVIDEADGYQPHLVAPEMGYRRLLEEALVLLKGPADIAVDDVHIVLKNIVEGTSKSDELRQLQRFGNLRREIIITANKALDKFKDETRRMVQTLVEMEASYLTAEYFRQILMSGAKVDGPITKGNERDTARTSEERELRRIAEHVSGYVNMVCTQLRHTVPKAIVHCLVVQAKKALLDALNEQVVGEGDAGLMRLLGEDEGIMKRREAAMRRLELLKRASEELSQATY